jgi:predicted SnoaL-like aldol condensation-catalyzing enzyme
MRNSERISWAIAILASAIAVWSIATRPDPESGTTSQAELDANKQILLDFFSFDGPRDVRADRFMTDDYVQHNPRLLKMDEITGASGRQSWIQGFEEAERQDIRIVDLGGIPLRDPVIVMAEGDLVTAIYRGEMTDPDDSNRAYEGFAFETVRIRDGKMSEHWDQVTLEPGWMNRGSVE